MKKTLTQFFILFTTLVLFVGCKKDDDDSSSTMVGKWFQVKEVQSLSVNNGAKENLTMTNFNKTNYMNFKQDGTVEVYVEKGISLHISGDSYWLEESEDFDSETSDYKYKVSDGYLRLTQGSHTVKAKLINFSERSFTIQVENSYKDSGKTFDSVTEAEYQKF